MLKRIFKSNFAKYFLGVLILSSCAFIATYAQTQQYPSATGGTTVNVNGGNVTSPNFNSTTPAAEAGYSNLKFQTSASSVSVEVQCGSGLSAAGNGCAANTSVLATHTAVQNNEVYCSSVTGNTTYTCTMPDTALTAYLKGQVFLLSVDTTCSTTCTLNVDTVGAKTVDKLDGSTAPNGALIATQPQWAYYDGTVIRLMGAAAQVATINSSNLAVVNTRRVCDIIVGDTSGSAITNAQLGPQKRACYIPAASTVVEMDVAGDAGTPNVIVGINHAGSISNIVSGALATASAGAIACSNTGGTTGIDGATTCSSTLQNTSAVAGDYFDLVSGTAGGTAKLMTIHVIYTIN